MYGVKERIIHYMLHMTTELLEQLRNKDEEAFKKLYQAYVKLVYHIAFSYTYNKEDAEDIVSEVFMKVLDSLDTYQEKGKFKEWISMITRNIALNFVTRDKHKEVLRDEEIIKKTKNYNENYNEMIIMFEEVLDKDTVSIMILRFIYGYKFKEIASILEMTIGKVQSMYYDGLEKLRKVY